MGNAPQKHNVIVVGGDAPLEVLGRDVREQSRLMVGESPATLAFLREYFAGGRDAGPAAAALARRGAPFLSLNGPYLCQFLDQHGFVAHWIPLMSTHKAELAEALGKDPLAVVLSTTFLPFAADIDRMARWIKEKAPGVTVIVGGIQVWKSYGHKRLLDAGRITPDIVSAVSEHSYLMDAERASPADLFVIGERGEDTLVGVLESLREGDDAHELDNVAYFKDGRWKINPVVAEPYREVRVEWGRFTPAGGEQYVPVQAGQGCGFHCTFCDFCGLRTRRVRDVESIMGEIRSIPSLTGQRRVYFTDDNLFATADRAREICRAMVGAGLKLRWRGMIRVSVLDEEIVALMAESGCTEVLLGIESGDPDILRAMGKPMTPETILEGIGLLARHGIHTKSTFIVGFPGETDRSVQNTIDLLNAYPTDVPAGHRYLFFTFAVLPLARIASPESRAKYGLRGYGFHWKHATMSSGEAAAYLADIQDAVKPELSPNYVLEVPDIRGLSSEDIKQAYLLRNLIVREQRGLSAKSSAAVLWDRLEELFSPDG
jgi:p-methyltransferase